MPEDSSDDPVEVIYNSISDFQRDFGEARRRKVGLFEVIDLVNSICKELERLDPKRKKFLHNASRNWPISLDADNLSWIRTDKGHKCPEEIKLIKEELGKMLSHNWPGGEEDEIGMVIKIITRRIILFPVATLEALTKTDPSLRFDNPEGYAFFHIWPHVNNPKEELVGKTVTPHLLPEYEKGNSQIQRIWAQEIFDYAFQCCPKDTLTDRMLTSLEREYKNNAGTILDPLLWDSKYYKLNPFLYSVFFLRIHKEIGEKNINLTKAHEVRDKGFRGKSINNIIDRLDAILGEKS